jgi:hypothetical protein
MFNCFGTQSLCHGLFRGIATRVSPAERVVAFPINPEIVID